MLFFEMAKFYSADRMMRDSYVCTRYFYEVIRRCRVRADEPMRQVHFSPCCVIAKGLITFQELIELVRLLDKPSGSELR